MTGFDDIAERVEEGREQNNNSSGSGGGSENDFDPSHYLKLLPTTAVGYDSIQRVITLGGSVLDQDGLVEQNISSDIGIIVENPTVLKGQLYEHELIQNGVVRVQDESEDYQTNVDYRIMDPEDSSFQESYDADGNLNGVDFKSLRNNYPGRPSDVDDGEPFAEEAMLILSGSSARRASRVLDANGAPSAGIQSNGTRSRGLVEYPPDFGEEDAPSQRYARYPQVRDDVDGGWIFIDWETNWNEDADERAYHVIIGDDDYEGDNYTDATFLDAVYAPDVIEDEDLYELYWADVEDAEEYSEAAEGDGDFTMSSDTEDESETIEGLSDNGRAFVEEMVSAAEHDNLTVNEETGEYEAIENFEEVVETNVNEGELNDDVDVDAMKSVIVELVPDPAESVPDPDTQPVAADGGGA